MNHALLVKSRVAAAAIGAYLIAAANGVAGQARVAAANTDKLLGVVNDMGASAAGQTVDVQEVGLADVRAGGAFADGDPLTANANGKAVLAAKVVGSTVSCIGFARGAAAAEDDIVPVLLAPFVIVG
jgi:hypothetical protein